MKALGLQPNAFIRFSVFGTRDEALALALAFDILLHGPTWNYAISLTNYAKETQLNEIQKGGWGAYMLLITPIWHEVYVERIFSLRELCFLRDLNIKGSTIRNTVYQTQNKTNRNIF